MRLHDALVKVGAFSLQQVGLLLQHFNNRLSTMHEWAVRGSPDQSQSLLTGERSNQNQLRFSSIWDCLL